MASACAFFPQIYKNFKRLRESFFVKRERERERERERCTGGRFMSLGSLYGSLATAARTHSDELNS